MSDTYDQQFGDDDEFGFDMKQALEVNARLRPHINALLDAKTDVPIVLTALGEGFFIALRMAGASKWQSQKWAKKVYRHMKVKGDFGFAVAAAYESLG